VHKRRRSKQALSGQQRSCAKPSRIGRAARPTSSAAVSRRQATRSRTHPAPPRPCSSAVRERPRVEPLSLESDGARRCERRSVGLLAVLAVGRRRRPHERQAIPFTATVDNPVQNSASPGRRRATTRVRPDCPAAGHRIIRGFLSVKRYKSYGRFKDGRRDSRWLPLGRWAPAPRRERRPTERAAGTSRRMRTRVGARRLRGRRSAQQRLCRRILWRHAQGSFVTASRCRNRNIPCSAS
jgi:hypothetical protein